MAKSILKFVFAFLLAAVLVIVPLLGIPQLGFSGLLTDDDLNVTNELAEGQLVQFHFSLDSTKDEATLQNNANRTAEILRKRLAALGYREAEVNVLSNRKVDLILPFNADASLVKNRLALTGEFIFKDNNGTKLVSSAGDIVNCAVTYATEYDSTGAGTTKYYLAFTLTEEALKKYTEATTKIASSTTNNYVQLFVDSASLSRLTISEAVTENGFSFGPFEYEDAVWYSTMINAGPLPQSVAPSTFSTAPVLGQGAFTGLFIGALVIAVLAAVACWIVYKTSGLAMILGAVSAMGVTLVLNTAFGLGVSLMGLCAVLFSWLLCLLVQALVMNAAKKESSSDPILCFGRVFKKSPWLLVDLLALPFAVSLGMMLYGNIYTMLFAELVFVAVVATGVSLLVSWLCITALADANQKRTQVYGN